MTTTVSYAEAAGLAGTDLGLHRLARDHAGPRSTCSPTRPTTTSGSTSTPSARPAGPFGAPIAHGFLTLSLAVKFWSELFDVEGVTTKVNYGLDKVRFISPVKVGSRVRMTAVIAEVTEVAGRVPVRRRPDDRDRRRHQARRRRPRPLPLLRIAIRLLGRPRGVPGTAHLDGEDTMHNHGLGAWMAKRRAEDARQDGADPR